MSYEHDVVIFPEGYELWHPHNWPVTTTNHLPPHLANYLDIKGCLCLFKHHSPKHTPDW